MNDPTHSLLTVQIYLYADGIPRRPIFGQRLSRGDRPDSKEVAWLA